MFALWGGGFAAEIKVLGIVLLVVVLGFGLMAAGVFWLKADRVVPVGGPGLSPERVVVGAEAGAPVVSAADVVPAPDGVLEARVAALEEEVEALRGVVASFDVGRVSEEREAIFSSEEGRAKADEFFEMGQFATAGEGYLTFLRRFPEHPDAEVILKRASEAFGRAGYTDKALVVSGSLVEAFPESRGDNVAELARMELGAKRYDDAVAHATEAAELADTVDERYWRLLYRAWYVQERDGVPAGLAAYKEVEAALVGEGLEETRMFARAVEKRQELEKRLR